VLRDLLVWLEEWPLRAPGVQPLKARRLVGSPIAGREGNHEYLLELVAEPDAAPSMPLDDAALRRIIEKTHTSMATAEG